MTWYEAAQYCRWQSEQEGFPERETLKPDSFIVLRQTEPTRFERGEPLETFLRTVILGDVLPLIPEDRRGAFVHDVAARMEIPEIDYVRLNIDARRA